MTEDRAPGSSPLVIPALVVGILALVLTPFLRAPIYALPVLALSAAAIVLGHLALPKSHGPRRWLAIGGLAGGYIAALAAAVTIALHAAS